MSNSAPSTWPLEYGPPPRLGVVPEGGGFTATCACTWLRWEPREGDARAVLAKHQKGCKARKGAAA